MAVVFSQSSHHKELEISVAHAFKYGYKYRNNLNDLNGLFIKHAKENMIPIEN